MKRGKYKESLCKSCKNKPACDEFFDGYGVPHIHYEDCPDYTPKERKEQSDEAD